MELHFVSRTALAALPEPAKERVDIEKLSAALDRAAVPDRMPFLIGDDGLPAAKVNDFFCDLPASGCRSPETWRAYALDVFRFLRYLDSVEQVDLFAATNEHVERYRWVRLNGSQPVRPSTWNREVAALQRFYGWAVRAATPPRCRSATATRPDATPAAGVPATWLAPVSPTPHPSVS